MEAIVLSERMVDIRPVSMRDPRAVVDAVRGEVARRGADGAFLVGWDPLLQSGLPETTLGWLDEIAPQTPLVIVHNSGHLAYFNSAAARRAAIELRGGATGRDRPRNSRSGRSSMSMSRPCGRIRAPTIG